MKKLYIIFIVTLLLNICTSNYFGLLSIIILLIVFLFNKKTIDVNKSNSNMQNAELFNNYAERSIKAEKSELELSTFFNITPGILGIATLDKFIRVNKKFVELTGYDKEELLNSSFLSFIHPDDVEKTLDIVKIALEGNAIMNFENRYRKKDNSYLIINWQFILENNIFYCAGVDVTLQKELLDTILNSEEKFRTFFDSALVPMGIFDKELFQFNSVNFAFADVLGYSKEELISNNLKMFLHPDDYLSSLNATKLPNDDLSNKNFKNRYICKNGDIIYIIWNSNKSEDKLVYCIGEITED